MTIQSDLPKAQSTYHHTLPTLIADNTPELLIAGCRIGSIILALTAIGYALKIIACAGLPLNNLLLCHTELDESTSSNAIKSCLFAFTSCAFWQAGKNLEGLTKNFSNMRNDAEQRYLEHLLN